VDEEEEAREKKETVNSGGGFPIEGEDWGRLGLRGIVRNELLKFLFDG
jgi:hypothetical protein